MSNKKFLNEVQNPGSSEAGFYIRYRFTPVGLKRESLPVFPNSQGTPPSRLRSQTSRRALKRNTSLNSQRRRAGNVSKYKRYLRLASAN